MLSQWTVHAGRTQQIVTTTDIDDLLGELLIYIMHPAMVVQQVQNRLQGQFRIISSQSCSAVDTRPNLANVDPWVLMQQRPKIPDREAECSVKT